MRGKVIKIVQAEEFRLATVRVLKPWSGNIWEDYDFPSNTLEIGDEVEVGWNYVLSNPAVQPVPGLPTAEDLDAVAKERKVASETDLPF